MSHKLITVSSKVQASIEKVWNLLTDPKHIINWNNASDDWHTPSAENDLRPGGKFNYRMAARDGSMQFDFEGVYDEIKKHELISYTLGDGRKVSLFFQSDGNTTSVTEIFEPESTHSLEMQQAGWQSILDNFKKYVEGFGKLETLRFEIVVNANVEKVYSFMLDEKHFAEWTSVFNPSSRFKGSWVKGSKILFLGESKEGKTEGMIGIVKENIPGKFVSIESIGMVSEDKEITTGPDLEGWVGGHENYSFSGDDRITTVTVDLDTNQQFKNYFLETYPKALEKLKSICEG
jgi:uncharacterized protein YndB with AHSA1/START domain